MKDYTILSRGPSLLNVTPADILPGSRVIAINGAIFHYAVPADVWVSLDYPGKHYVPGDVDKPWPGPVPPLFVTKASNKDETLRRWPELVCVADYADRTGWVPFASLAWEWWIHWSILVALFYAHTQGGTRFRLLGVDMEGDRYAHSNARLRGTADERWPKERRDLAQAMTELTHRGCTFDFGEGKPAPELHATWRCSLPYEPPKGRDRFCPHPPITLDYYFGPMVCRCSHASLEMVPVEARDLPEPV